MFIWVIDHARDRQGHPGLGGFLVHFSFQGGQGFFFLVPSFTFYFMGEAGLQSPFWFCFCFSFHPGQRRQVSKENVLLFHFIQDGGDEGRQVFSFFLLLFTFSFHPGWKGGGETSFFIFLLLFTFHFIQDGGRGSPPII